MNIVLSPDALRISPAEHAAILEVRELFSTGHFIHDYEQNCEEPNGFNMECLLSKGDCGTTACIGGWMWTIMNRDRTTRCVSPVRYINQDRSDALKPLFYPPHEDIGDTTYDYITPGAALVAIDTFLAGKLDWAIAVGAHIGEVEHA